MWVLKVNVISLPWPKVIYILKLNFLFLVATGQFSANFICKACRYEVTKIHQHNAGHMTKMAAMPIYGKKTL